MSDRLQLERLSLDATLAGLGEVTSDTDGNQQEMIPTVATKRNQPQGEFSTDVEILYDTSISCVVLDDIEMKEIPHQNDFAGPVTVNSQISTPLNLSVPLGDFVDYGRQC